MRILVRHNNGARAHAKAKEEAQAHYAPSPTAASRPSTPPCLVRVGLEPVCVRVHLGVLAGLGLGMPAWNASVPFKF